MGHTASENPYFLISVGTLAHISLKLLLYETKKIFKLNNSKILDSLFDYRRLRFKKSYGAVFIASKTL